jgi:hypothetical protein
MDVSEAYQILVGERDVKREMGGVYCDVYGVTHD